MPNEYRLGSLNTGAYSFLMLILPGGCEQCCPVPVTSLLDQYIALHRGRPPFHSVFCFYHPPLSGPSLPAVVCLCGDCPVPICEALLGAGSAALPVRSSADPCCLCIGCPAWACSGGGPAVKCKCEVRRRLRQLWTASGFVSLLKWQFVFASFK